MKDDGITTGKVRHLRVLDTSVPPPLPPPTRTHTKSTVGTHFKKK